MTTPPIAKKSVSISIAGAGGAGAMTAGGILLEAAGKSGWYGMMNRSVGPQIRGGEAAALLRLANHPVECMSEGFDLLIAIDWKNASRFAAEMPLKKTGLVIADPSAGDVPDAITAYGAEVIEVEIKKLAKSVPGGRENMVAAGLAAGFIGLSEDFLMEIINAKLARKGDAAVESSRLCLEAGLKAAAEIARNFEIGAADMKNKGRWLITGNEAVGLGAIRGGVRYAAAYPITPATEVLEWLSPALAKIGGALVQAEDELSSINMAIGASYGGRPSITATSGPGLSLMMESLGLAAAAEVPVVVVDVMRCGPSTGIATKSEQSDLNIAVYGFHGDAPHVVCAPLSVADCLYTGQWAVHLAEAMQVPVIVLSDQSLGQARVLMKRPVNLSFLANRKVYKQQSDEPYMRYAITADGVSPMAIPGTPGGQYTADGLTHSVRGTPSTQRSDQQNQMDKRHRKVADFDYGIHWGEVSGVGEELVILTWGSITAPAKEAIRTLNSEGIDVKLVAMRLISPFPKDALLEALQGAKRILIVEQTHAGQFHSYLRANCDLPGEIRQFHRPGPHLISATEITSQIRDWAQS
ncbi:MAG: 2-oxoacid:acceptor oxidoreductase subunit alpha [Rhodobacteraceae bacterium]|nr:2-oxoacid:acceptor oxidoreductase subunit alpha [Paracoccaceae bacterium]